MLEDRIKEVWPSALGPCRFAFSNPQETPVSILHLISSKTIHKDGQGRFRYQADIFTNALDTTLVRNQVKSIISNFFTIQFLDYRYEYIEERKMYRHICDLFINFNF
jgi:hypothetical protein